MSRKRFLSPVRPRLSRRGVTLVESLIAIGILSLLAAIALPAVQSARETSRKLQCSNHLRQLILANTNYHDLYSQFPPLQNLPSECAIETVFTRLLPFLELGNICGLLASEQNRLPILECPSDSDIAKVDRPLSYVVNASPGEGSGSTLLAPFNTRISVSMRDVTDGLSQTAAMSENIVVRNGGTESEANASPTRYLWGVDIPPLPSNVAFPPQSPQALAERAVQAESAISDCVSGSRIFIPMDTAELGQWHTFRFGGGGGNYSHWFPPNSPDCIGMNGPLDSGTILDGNGRCASLHPGGVNLVFLDGHVRFVSNHINREVWRASGTCNGNETSREGGL